MEIKIENLQKKYGKKIVLNNVNMEIGTGVFGLLGENGAGKSSLMKILATISQRTAGNITINGYSIDNIKRIRNMLGYLPQDFDMYGGMSVIGALNYFATLSKIPREKRKDRINFLMGKLNLKEQATTKIKNLSGGMLKRLGIAQALLNDPEVLIIDEPTAGLDPEERIRIRNILCEISQKKIVLLSTHIVEDIEMTCSKLAILSAGRILYTGSIQQLLNLVDGKVFLVEIEKSMVDNIKLNYRVINIQYRENKAYCRLFSENIPPFSSCKPVEPSLEDGYIAVLGGQKDVIS